MTRNRMIAAAVAVAIVAAAVTGVVLFLHGHDFHTVATGSMDGDVHPDGCYRCDSCDGDWIPSNLSKAPAECPYCGSTVFRHVDHTYRIGGIPVNSLVVVDRMSGSEKNGLNVGDVVAFDHNGRETVHRVIEVYRDTDGITQITTSGDNTTGTETVTDMSLVHGVVTYESSLLGGVVNALRGSTFLLIAAVVILAVAASTVYDIVKTVRQGKQD